MSIQVESQIHLAGEGHDPLTLHHGWSNVLASQLVERSQEEHIQEWTPGDVDKFVSIDIIKRWHRENFEKKNSSIAWLGTAANQLAGIAWIENTQNRTTPTGRAFGVRVYDGYRGVGYASLLSEEVHHLVDDRKRGLRTSFVMFSRNNAGFSIGARLGYQLESDSTDSKGTQLYVRNGR